MKYKKKCKYKRDPEAFIEEQGKKVKKKLGINY